ncbi:MAG: hypothetical protein ACTSVI_04085 [Promethearchaeota archaeon]
MLKNDFSKHSGKKRFNSLIFFLKIGHYLKIGDELTNNATFPDLLQKRGVLDHDIFLDHEKRIYFVLGHYQPEKRIISILKYFPSDAGTWIQKLTGTRYKRTYWHQGIEAFKSSQASIGIAGGKQLESFWIRDPVFNTEFTEVPFENIMTYLLPENRVKEIFDENESKLDDLESKVKHVVGSIINNFSFIKLKDGDIGITGSVLWKGHSERSDINLNVYGLKKCIKLNDALTVMAGEEQQLDNDLFVKLKGFGELLRIKTSDNIKIFSLKRKVKLKLEGFTPGIQIRWCLKKNEFNIKYGDETYSDIGLITVKLRIIDDTYSIFFPAMVYVEPLDADKNIVRVMIYDSRYTRLLKKNDTVKITGLLQRINDDDSFQILIGSKKYSDKENVTFIQAKH